MSRKNHNPNRYRVPEWDHFKVGDLVEMKGAFFKIHRINPLARQIILVGIKDPRQPANPVLSGRNGDDPDGPNFPQIPGPEAA